MPRRTLTRTVRFWRFRAVDRHGDDAPIPVLDFRKVLTLWTQRAATSRKLELDGDEYLFDPRPTSADHLAIHKLRSPLDFMSQVRADGTVSEIMAVDAQGNTLADSAAVSFVHSLGGRVFGIVGGNQSAPRAHRVAQWINEIKAFGGDLQFSVVPLTSEPRLDRLDGADGARRITFTARAADLTPQEGSELYTLSQELLDKVPDVQMTITLSSGHATPPRDIRDALGDLADALAKGLHGDGRGQAAVVREVQAKAKGKTKFTSELIELVEYQLAQEFEIGASEAGVNIDHTLQGVDRIADNALPQMRAILGVDALPQMSPILEMDGG